jgi:hypothetical protein
VPFLGHSRIAASLKRQRKPDSISWLVLSIDMCIIATASFSGTYCISRAPAIQRAKVVSTFFHHQMTLPRVHTMPPVFITTKVLRNISTFRIRTNMQI